MNAPRVFALYCLLVLLGFSAAKYQGWTLFGSTGQATTSPTGGTRSGGVYGFHK